MPPEIQLQLAPQILGMPVTPEQRKEVESRLKDLQSAFGDSLTVETSTGTSGTETGTVNLLFRPGKPPLSDSGGGSGGSTGGGDGNSSGGRNQPVIIDIAYLAAWSSVQTADMLARSTKEIVVNASENQRTEAAAALKKLIENINLKPLMQVVEVLVKVLSIAVSAVVLAMSIAAAVASGGAALPVVAAVIAGIGALMAVVGATPAVDEMARNCPGAKIAWDVITIVVSLAGLGVGIASSVAKTAAEGAVKIAETTAKETMDKVKEAMTETIQKAIREGGREAGQVAEESAKQTAKLAGEQAGREAGQEALKAGNREVVDVMARRMTLVGKGVGGATAVSGAFSAGLNAWSEGNESEALQHRAGGELAKHNQEAALKLGEETMESMKAVTDAALAIMDSYATVVQSMHNSRALATSI